MTTQKEPLPTWAKTVIGLAVLGLVGTMLFKANKDATNTPTDMERADGPWFVQDQRPQAATPDDEVRLELSCTPDEPDVSLRILGNASSMNNRIVDVVFTWPDGSRDMSKASTFASSVYARMSIEGDAARALVRKIKAHAWTRTTVATGAPIHWKLDGPHGAKAAIAEAAVAYPKWAGCLAGTAR